MSRSSVGSLFHTVGQETEKAHPPSFVTADLAVDDLSRLLVESDSVNVTRFRRYAGQQW